MSDRCQGAPSERSGSGDPVSRIEAALGMLRGGPRGFGPRGGGPQGGGPHGGDEGGGRHHGRGPHSGGHHGRGPHGAGHHGDAAPGDPERGSWRGPGGRGGQAALRVLHLLDEHGPASVGELAERIGVDQPRASRLVAAAVAAGHVRREPDPNDARRAILVITDSGRQALRSLLGRRRGAVERALEGFSDDERAQFAELFARFAEGWRRG